MFDDSLPPFPFPAVGRQKVTAAFDGGRLSSDGGVMLLAGLPCAGNSAPMTLSGQIHSRP